MNPEIQLPLLEGVPPIQLDAKQEGMQRVARNANPAWAEFAYRCASEVAAEMVEFTSDDVEDKMQSHVIPNRPVTHDKRAMGPIMNRIAAAGIAFPTQRVMKSRRQKLHGSPRMIWRSMIYREPALASSIADDLGSEFEVTVLPNPEHGVDQTWAA